MNEDEDLGNVLTDSYKEHQKDIAIKTLGGRTHLSIAKIAKLLEHKEHGATIGAITLDDLLTIKNGAGKSTPVAAVAAAAAAPAPRKAAKKAGKKAAKKAGKKAAKKAGKKAAPKAKVSAAPKAKAGKGSKPRLVRDVAYKEVKAALKSLKGNCSNGDLVKATKYTPVQIRTFLNELIESGDVAYEGKGRGMKYSLA